MADKIFNELMIKSEPEWKFWCAHIFGKTLYREAGLTFKKWRGCMWIFGCVEEEDNQIVL